MDYQQSTLLPYSYFFNKVIRLLLCETFITKIFLLNCFVQKNKVKNKDILITL
jgi:hypothetical protein